MLNVARFGIGGDRHVNRWPNSIVVTPYDELEVSITPGPSALDEPAVSWDIDEVIEYPPEQFTETVLALPNTRLLSAPNASWWDWKARCEFRDGYIVTDMTLLETEPPSWGGSMLDVQCGAESLLQFWLAIRESCPAAWLHDADGRMYSPETFRQMYI